VTYRGDRATAPFEDICHRAFPALFSASWYTKAACDVAHVGDRALIFVAAVAIAVALLLLLA
jgi:hypothetical protein